MRARLATLALAVLVAAAAGCRNTSRAPDVSKLRTADEVRDAYLKALDAGDTATMAALADVPWLDTDRRFVRDREALGKAVERAAGQMPKRDQRKVETLAYKEFRGKVEKEADRKLLDEALGDDGSVVYVENDGRLLSERCLLIRVKDGVARVVGGPLKPNQLTPQNELPEAVNAALEKSESFELFSLDPGSGMRGKDKIDPMKEQFHGYEVLGKTVVKGEDRGRVVAALRQGVEDNAGTVAGCFIPRHGVRLTSGKDVIELVICFQCLSVNVYVDGKQGKGFLTTGDPQPAFDAVLKAAGVALPGR